MYANNPQPTETYGVLATIVTSAKVPDDVVYQLVKATFDNFEEFKKLHPAFANLKAEEMVKNGLSAPLHAGRREVLQGEGLGEVTAYGPAMHRGAPVTRRPAMFHVKQRPRGDR